MICAGVDAGSRTIKIILLDRNTLEVAASGIMDQGVKQVALARELFTDLLHEAGLGSGDMGQIIATGYGRHTLTFADTTITEITCHARGVHHVVPEAKTIIDIGGQDSKLIRLDEQGAVQDFVMNDRCAAGTGCFLEMVARRLDATLHDLGEIAGRSRNPAAISSMCVVFAETEIVGLLAAETPPEDIVAGVQLAIARRLCSMAGRKTEAPVVLTGGVALVPGMNTALESVLRQPVSISPDPQMTGALGAAILACRKPGALHSSG